MFPVYLSNLYMFELPIQSNTGYYQYRVLLHWCHDLTTIFLSSFPFNHAQEENSDIKRNVISTKMSNFNIDDEIDKAIDKIAEQLKSRLKKLIMRSEKQVLRQYIASQKETAKAAKAKSSGRRSGHNTGSGQKVIEKQVPADRAPKREDDYGSGSDSEYSDSE